MKQTIQVGHKRFTCDFGFLFILVVLCGTSCFALYNAFNLIRLGSGQYYLNRQIVWYGIGFLTMWLMSKKPNKFFYQLIPKAYQYLMIVLIYLLASKVLEHFTGFSLPMANDINGAYSWIQIPGIGSFQASEFMKVVLILKTSLIVTDWQKKYPNPTVLEDFYLFSEILRWALPPMLLILLEPDTGVFIIIAFTLLVLVCCSGIRTMYIWIALALVLSLVGGFFFLYFFYHDVLTSFVSAYQLRRIDAWIYPEQNILSASNQLYTALLSLGSAGISGHGLQANIISIPEAHTDFIFAAFGQCFGLIGTSYILIVCLWLDLYLCKMAYNSKNTGNRLIIIGTIAMLLYQQVQNLGMIIGLIPITGITLPLISYGGSSTLSYFILFGIILNMSPQNLQGWRLHPRIVVQAFIDLFQEEPLKKRLLSLKRENMPSLMGKKMKIKEESQEIAQPSKKEEANRPNSDGDHNGSIRNQEEEGDSLKKIETREKQPEQLEIQKTKDDLETSSILPSYLQVEKEEPDSSQEQEVELSYQEVLEQALRWQNQDSAESIIKAPSPPSYIEKQDDHKKG